MYPFKPSIVRVSISSRSAYFCTIRMKWQHKKNNKQHTSFALRLNHQNHRFSSPRSQNLPRRWSWQYHHRAHRTRAADNLPSSPRRRRRQSRPLAQTHSGKVSLGAAKRKIIINDDDKDKHSKRLALLRRNDRKNSEKTSTPCRISEPRRTK